MKGNTEIHLFKFDWGVGRGYEVDALFIATQAEVDNIIGKSVYFGEICGKHSEVEIDIEKGHIRKLGVDSATCQLLANELGSTLSGHNPVEYWQDHNDE